ncbi:thiamine diphosphokinase [Blattabacterium cuenoti]|uniref:thiamine diphosphokinase n=1 Tax=Blattabacterium cuenoti TaxID=1653831 RepID=UPI00163D303D|nr:thiamine diphosphokinase [Blattabacterium cuenoti]
MNHRFKGPKVGLFLNGEPPSLSYEETFFYEKIFSVDGAFYYLTKSGISIDYIIGDFDSISKKDITLEKTIFTYNQKYTDFDKALNIIYRKGYLNIDVWGGSGREQDHFLGNLSTALKYKKKLSIIFHDKYHSYFFSDRKTVFYQKKNKKISLFPFPLTKDLKTKGLKYKVNKDYFKIGKKIGIRNKTCNKKIEISYSEGELLIFVER